MKLHIGMIYIYKLSTKPSPRTSWFTEEEWFQTILDNFKYDIIDDKDFYRFTKAMINNLGPFRRSYYKAIRRINLGRFY